MATLRLLGTLLALRGALWARRARARSRFAVLELIGGPIVLAWIAGTVGRGAYEVGSLLDPSLLLALWGAAAVFGHVGVFTEALFTSATQGQGMAPALYAFPLTPRVIHLAEVLAGVVRPGWIALVAGLVGLSLALGSPLAAGGALAFGLYLLALRQLLRLALWNLLRKRWVRELVLAGGSLAGVFVWLGFIATQRGLEGVDITALVAGLDPRWAYHPALWFAAPFAASVDPLARGVGLIGASVALGAVLWVGAELQDRACYGELEAGGWGSVGRRRERSGSLIDRAPWRWVHPSIWATAGKELRVLRRDPFLLTMLFSQALLLLLPPLLMVSGWLAPAGLGRAATDQTSGFYMPALLALLVVAEHPPVFNQLASEGRALHFLAQVPVPRWRILLGKNLAFAGLFLPFNLLFLAATMAVFDRWEQWGLYAGISTSALVVLLGVGNLASVVAPTPWLGARAQAGGARAARAASEGGVQQPGCGTRVARFVLLQAVLVLSAPPALLLVAGWRWLPGWTAGLATGAAAAWVALVWLGGTWIATAHLEQAEEKLLGWLASSAAS